MAVEQNGKVSHGLLFTSVILSSQLGFTAVVNKELSAKYDTLVAQAPELIKVLPWGKDFEVETFRKPDFTSLTIVSFATNGDIH